MIDLYTSVLNDGRSPERAEMLIKIVEILYESGYDMELDQILTLVSKNDSVNEIILPLESIIADCSRSLLLKLGVDIDLTDIHTYVADVYSLLITIIEKVEFFDDYDAMLAIVDSGEPDVIVLSNLVAYVEQRPISHLPDIIHNVEDKIIRVIRSMLVARGLADYDEFTVDIKAATRTANFIALYPDNYVSEVLDDNGYAQSEEVIITLVDISSETENYLEAIALVAAGIAVAKNEEFQDAYEAIERIVDQILDDDFSDQKLLVTNAAFDSIKPIYEVEEVEDET